MEKGCNWLFPLAETLQLYSSGRGLFPACGKDSTEGTPQGFTERSGGLGGSSTYVNPRPQTPSCFSPHPTKAGPREAICSANISRTLLCARSWDRESIPNKPGLSKWSGWRWNILAEPSYWACIYAKPCAELHYLTASLQPHTVHTVIVPIVFIK